MEVDGLGGGEKEEAPNNQDGGSRLVASNQRPLWELASSEDPTATVTAGQLGILCGGGDGAR